MTSAEGSYDGVSYTTADDVSYTAMNDISYTATGGVSYKATDGVSYAATDGVSYAATDDVSYTATDSVSYTNSDVVSHTAAVTPVSHEVPNSAAARSTNADIDDIASLTAGDQTDQSSTAPLALFFPRDV